MPSTTSRCRCASQRTSGGCSLRSGRRSSAS
jgi:hypothetical protein